MTLSCKKLVQKLDNHLKGGGLWLFSDFRIGSGFNKIWQLALLRLMYLFFKFSAGLNNRKLYTYEKFFTLLNFIKVEEKYFLWGND